MAEIGKQYVLTIGTGKQLYVDLAANLARSFLFWNGGGKITFQLVTDLPELVPADLKDKIQVVVVNPGELGSGFSPKLHLDKLVNEGQTLFIDSDCLVFGKLDALFHRLSGHEVSVVGGYISKGEWFGDVEAVCKQFNIPHMPKFNGGLYYVEKGDRAAQVYKTARDIEKRYDEIGFVRLRNRPNDEVIMALAMQLHGQKPVIDDGTIMSDPQACPGGYKIDVVSGERWLVNPPAPDPRHQIWYPFTKVSPVIVHFLGYYTSKYPYVREVYRLKKALSKDLNWFSELVGLLRIEYSSRIREQFKNMLRPIYHRLIGYRKVKASERL
jgi:hypothetical protein